ncbi:MAG TPA: rod shape-determining protein RodA [Caulobacteraceae bacterium]|jgi:rod shape determining protein RodA
MTASAITRPGERDRLSVKLGQIDWRLTGVITLIACAGGLMQYSIAGGHWQPWAAQHMLLFGAFLLLMIVLAVTDLRVWFVVAYPTYVVGLVLLAAVMVVGHSSLGAERWLKIGPLHLQPSEIMKIGLVLALARFYHGLSAKEARWSWKLLIPVVVIAAPVALVLKQPDLGTAILLAATGLMVIMLAGLDLRVIIAGLVAGAAATPVFVFLVMKGHLVKGYQAQRLLTFLHPDTDPSGAGYHILQAKIALGSGGILGKGYGLGSQSQLNFLPEKQTDFIFATLAEEFGFVGCISILILYAAAIVIALRIASISHSHFGRLSAAGVTATFALYVLINGAMVMGLAPVVGVPMPLLSFGGTVMLTVMVAFGLIQSVRVHRYTEVSRGAGALI